MKFAFLLYCMIILSISGCVDKTEKIDLNIVQEPEAIINDSSVKVAIGSIVSPKESYGYYEDMIRYVSRSLGVNVKIIQRRNYQEINDLIKRNEIDFAFVCSGPYVDGNTEFGMKLLVVPVINGGDTTYHSYIIVRNNSNYSSLSDLRGKKFAFVDPLSNTGRLYPAYRLYLMNETPGSFFGIDEQGKNNSFYTYSHDNSIIAVAENIAEGASVSSLVYENMKNTYPETIAKTRIIEISQPFGNPPIVVSKDVDPFLEERLRDIFLKMNENEDGKEVLARVKIDKFVNLSDNAYDSIREMRKRVQ